MLLISSAPARLLVFSLVTMRQNLKITCFGKSILIFTFNRQLLHHITLLLMTSLNVPTGKSLRFCVTLQNIYRKLVRIRFLTLLPLLAAVNSSIGKTPHYILYGFEKRLPYDVLVPFRVPLYSPDDYSKLQLHCFQTIHKSVREKLKASREEMLHKQHSQATPVHLDVDDSVMKRAPDCSCKLTPEFSGPFLLTAKLHGNKFKTLDPNTNVSEVVHVTRLKEVSASFTPAVVSSPPFPTDLLSSLDAHPSHSYKLRSAVRQ